MGKKPSRKRGLDEPEGGEQQFQHAPAQEHVQQPQAVQAPEEQPVPIQPSAVPLQPSAVPLQPPAEVQQHQQPQERLAQGPVSANPLLEGIPLLGVPLQHQQPQLIIPGLQGHGIQLPAHIQQGLSAGVGPGVSPGVGPGVSPLQSADPSLPPKKKRRPRAKTRDSDDNPNVLVDENGKHIPIPPKHGTPIKHSRPKRAAVPRKSGLGEEEPNMLMRIHVRRFEGDLEADAYPPGTLHAHPSMTLDALRHKIHSLVPSLPARALSFFKKTDGEQYQRVDSSSRYTKCLRTVGYDEPGPHDIWVEVDMAELVKPQAAAAESGQNQADLAESSQAHAQGVQDPTLLPSEHTGEYQGGEDGADPGAAGSSDLGPIHHRSMNKRSNKKWTEEEVEHLLLGLMKYGTSSWTTIAKTWKFEDRTTVDLKDKWRNLVKNVRDGRVMRGMVLTEEAKNRVWRIIHENGIESTPQNQRFQMQIMHTPDGVPLDMSGQPMAQAPALEQGEQMQQTLNPQAEQLQTPELPVDNAQQTHVGPAEGAPSEIPQPAGAAPNAAVEPLQME